MTEKKEKVDLDKAITKGFEDWDKVFTDLAKSAEDCYMPLLAKSLGLCKEILAVYKKSFDYSLKNK